VNKTTRCLLTFAGGVFAVGALALLTPRLAQTQAYSSPMRDVDNPARQPVSITTAINVDLGASSAKHYHSALKHVGDGLLWLL
jgi:hypothetical protein